MAAWPWDRCYPSQPWCRQRSSYKYAELVYSKHSEQSLAPSERTMNVSCYQHRYKPGIITPKGQLILFTSILQTRKLRVGEVSVPARGHPAEPGYEHRHFRFQSPHNVFPLHRAGRGLKDSPSPIFS